MTANLTVPADVWACQQPGVPFVAAIVEGVLETGFYFGPDRFTPPAWLVALRDARCGTCEGHGYRVHPEDGSSEPCDDGCHSGRLLHDVRVEMIPYSYHGDPCPCGLPADEHYYTVRCLVDVVKVRRDYTDHGSPAVVVMCEPMVSAGRVFWVAADGSSSVALTPAHVDALAESIGITEPADWPGCWAVVLTEEAE